MRCMSLVSPGLAVERAMTSRSSVLTRSLSGYESRLLPNNAADATRYRGQMPVAIPASRQRPPGFCRADEAKQLYL